MTIVERVIKCITAKIGTPINNITRRSHLQNDLCADSLDILMIRLEIENEFGITFTNEELKNMLTVDSICTTIEKREDYRK